VIRLENYIKLYIDPDEPLNSFLDKIKSAEEDKVVVIVHRKSPIFVGQVNIELIKKYAKEAEKELIFITNNKKIKNILSRVGFEVYSKVKEFEDNQDEEVEDINESERESLFTLDQYSTAKRKSKKRRKLKKGLFFATALLAAIIWVYFAFPVITVEIQPTIKDKVLVSQIRALENLPTIDWATSTIPLIKKEVNLEEELVFQSTATKEIGVKKATGVLTLINSNRKNITIPAGTLVSTRNGVKFKTKDKVVVPSSKLEKFMDVVVGVDAGRAEVNIEALYKGVHGNISKGRIVNFVNKDYPVKIVNPEATYGGQNQLVKVVSQADLENALSQTRDKLLQRAKEDLKNKFDSNLIFFKDEIKVAEPKLYTNNKVGEITNELVVKGEVKITGFAVEKEGLKSLVFKLYKDSLEDKFVLNRPQITIKEVKIDKVAQNEINFRVKSMGQVVGKINKEYIVNQILGKRVEEAKALMDSMLEIDSYQIKPVNQVNLPQFKYGINLVVDGENGYSN
jgi:hypothetical protein